VCVFSSQIHAGIIIERNKPLCSVFKEAPVVNFSLILCRCAIGVVNDIVANSVTFRVNVLLIYFEDLLENRYLVFLGGSIVLILGLFIVVFVLSSFEVSFNCLQLKLALSHISLLSD